MEDFGRKGGVLGSSGEFWGVPASSGEWRGVAGSCGERPGEAGRERRRVAICAPWAFRHVGYVARTRLLGKGGSSGEFRRVPASDGEWPGVTGRRGEAGRGGERAVATCAAPTARPVQLSMAWLSLGSSLGLGSWLPQKTALALWKLAKKENKNAHTFSSSCVPSSKRSAHWLDQLGLRTN